MLHPPASQTGPGELDGLGVKISDDLQPKVNDGVLSEDDAREMTRLRAERARLAGTVQEAAQVNQTQQAQAHVTGVRTSIQTWEQGIAQRDPDYALKKDTVMTFAKALIAERGLPQNPAQAVAYAEEAYRQVNDTFRRARPAPTPTRQTPTGVQAATGGTPEPRNLMEAMKIGLDRARSGN